MDIRLISFAQLCNVLILVELFLWENETSPFDVFVTRFALLYSTALVEWIQEEDKNILLFERAEKIIVTHAKNTCDNMKQFVAKDLYELNLVCTNGYDQKSTILIVNIAVFSLQVILFIC